MERKTYRATFLCRQVTGAWYYSARVLKAVNEFQARMMANGIAAANGWKVHSVGRAA